MTAAGGTVTAPAKTSISKGNGCPAMMRYHDWRGPIVWLSLGVLSVSGLSLMAASDQWRRAPSLPQAGSAIFNKTRHDFGKVRAGGELTCSFRLTNRSRQPLLIRRIKASCGCLMPEFDKSPVPSGQWRDLSVALRTEGLEPPLAIEKRISVELANDNREFVSVLSVSAELRPDIQIQPPELTFDSSGSAKQQLALLTIRSDLLSDHEFSSLRVVPSGRDCSVQEITRTGDMVRSAVRLQNSGNRICLKKLEVRYERDHEQFSVSVPVSVTAAAGNLRLVPSSYMANPHSDKSVASRWGPLAQRVQLIPDDKAARVTVTGVRFSSQQDQHLIGWDLLPEEPDRFVLWQKDAPRKQTVRSDMLEIAFELAGRHGVTRGEIPFTAYALSTGL